MFTRRNFIRHGNSWERRQRHLWPSIEVFLDSNWDAISLGKRPRDKFKCWQNNHQFQACSSKSMELRWYIGPCCFQLTWRFCILTPEGSGPIYHVVQTLRVWEPLGFSLYRLYLGKLIWKARSEYLLAHTTAATKGLERRFYKKD